MKKKIVSALLVAGGLSLGGVAAAEIASPAMLAGTCAACHGPDGSSVEIMPSIAGMPADFFVETMQAFRDGTRKATVMDRIAKGYSDAELQAMGKFFAAQRPVPQKQAFDTRKASLGRTLHADQCESCHEDGGRTPDEGGVLAGQSMLYLQFAMEDFRDGHREAPRKMRNRVRNVMEGHGEAGIEALIHYYASQN